MFFIKSRCRDGCTTYMSAGAKLIAHIHTYPISSFHISCTSFIQFQWLRTMKIRSPPFSLIWNTLKSETEKAWKWICFPAFFLFQQNFESAVHQSCPLAKLYVTHAPGKPTLPLTTRLEHIAEICRNLYHLQLHIIMNFPRSNFDLLRLLVVVFCEPIIKSQ